MSKLVICKSCGKEVAKGAKCPNCGHDQRNFFMKHKIITVILAIVIIGGIGSATNKGSTTTASTSTPAKTVTATAPKVVAVPAKPIINAMKVSPDVMQNAYTNNQVKADSLYKGKLIQMTGTVDSVTTALGQVSVSIDAGNDGLSTIDCSFDDGVDTAKIGALDKGNTVTITGTGDGEMITLVSLKGCTIK